MVARKKRTTSQNESGPAQKPLKKTTPLGPETALTLPVLKDKSLELSYWDLWFALVAVKDFGGDLDRLANHLGEKQSFVYFDRRSVERKRNHLRDLKRRLERASATPTQIVNAAGDLAKIELRRAIKKVRESCDREREWSEPMRNTPRKRLFEHALRGYWERFPVSPKPYAKEIGSHFNPRTFYPEGASFRLSDTLDRYVDRADKLSKSGQYAEAQALLRAWMTAIIELLGHADDSCGSIGMSFDGGFAAYLKIPLDKTRIDEDVFFRDLLDFLVWEDYGLTDDPIEGYFQGITAGQADLCIGHLRLQIEELKTDDLEYQSEEALTLLGRVVAEQERFDEFEDVARQMGSRAWRRIVRLVDRAMKRQNKPLAIKVFEAAMTKGDHLDFLKEKYEKLKRGHWSPDPRK
jgi:hypothetical protein